MDLLFFCAALHIVAIVVLFSFAIRKLNCDNEGMQCPIYDQTKLCLLWQNHREN